MTEVVDLAAGTDDDRGGLPPTEGLRLLTADGTRVIVRPSGTEPKVKCYLEVIVPVDPPTDGETSVAPGAHGTPPAGRASPPTCGRRSGSSASGCR